MDNRSKMKNKLIQYFQEGCKTTANGLGMEIEHFLIDEKSLRSYAYDEENGQRDLLNQLIERGWQLISEEEGNPLGIEKAGSTITLEPGGQVEVSLKIFSDIYAIEQAYEAIINEMKSVLIAGQAIVALGYHPLTKISDLPLLPKERYHHMYAYFSNHGEKSHNMMKGTAASQVSIDYRDEEDFVKKARVAHFIGPLLSRIFDSAPVFEGQIVAGHNLRIDIWQRTDPARSKYPIMAFEPDFGFEAYAEYLLTTPPIFTKLDDTYLFTEDETLEELVKRLPVDKIDPEHITSMVFPDVRLKRYIEIRMADAMPAPYVFALPAIIKGIFYNDEVLNTYYDFAQKYTLEDARVINKQLQKTLDFTHKGISINWFMMKLLLDAKRGISEKDQAYIDLIFEQIDVDGSYSEKLKKWYQEDKDSFLGAIRV